MTFGRTRIIETERRAVERSDLACQALLRTSYGVWAGELTDISVSGARFQASKPPKEGATALIAWDSHEVLCQIVWTKADQCGVKFEKLIPEFAVRESVARNARMEPPASLGNIPLGQKRAR